jgi:outer membrane murein-binding lipoprotein Lpp
VGVIWSTLNKKIEVLEEAGAAAKEHARAESEKSEDRAKERFADVWASLNKLRDDTEAKTAERFADVWGHVNKLRDDTVEIKEFRGSLTSKIEGLEAKVAELPSYRDFSAMLRETEERLEARLTALIDGIRGGK